MAVTADQVVVQLQAQTAQYEAGMRKAAGEAERFEKQALAVVVAQTREARALYESAKATTAKGSAEIKSAAAALQAAKSTEAATRAEIAHAAALRQMAVAADTAHGSLNNIQGSAGGIAAQFNDIGVSAAGGMNPLLIALQQGTQLTQGFAGQSSRQVLSGLGAAFASVVSPVSLVTIGLVAGAAALIQWAAGALGAGDSTEEFDKSLQRANDHLERMRELSQSLSVDGLDELRQKYGEVTEEVLRMVAAQERAEERAARRELGENIGGLQSQFGQTNMQFLAGLTDGAGEAERTFNELMANLQSQLLLTDAQASKLATSMTAVFSAQNDTDRAAALADVRSQLEAIVEAGGESADASDEMLTKILGAEDATRILAALAGGLPGVFNAAASAAAGIAAELDRAVAAAGRLANAGVGDLQTARINAQFRTDPVGRAGALAAAQFDADVGNLGAVPNDHRQVLQEQRREYVENAKAAATLAEQTQALNDADREAARLAEKKGSDGAKEAQKSYNELLSERKSLLEAIQTPLQQYQEALALIDQLATTRDAKTGDFLITEEQANAARKRLESLQPVAQDVSNALKSAFEGAFDDPAKALEELGKRLLEIMLYMQLAKSFPSIFGAGGIVPLGYSQGGYTGPGGVNQAAGVVHKGEVVFSQSDVARNGGVAAVEAMRLGLRGYAGGGAVNVPTMGIAGSYGGGSSVTVIDQRGAGAPAIETQTTRGPNGRDMVTMWVKEDMARGKFNGPMNGVYGQKPQKVTR